MDLTILSVCYFSSCCGSYCPALMCAAVEDVQEEHRTRSLLCSLSPTEQQHSWVKQKSEPLAITRRCEMRMVILTGEGKMESQEEGSRLIVKSSSWVLTSRCKIIPSCSVSHVL